MTVSTWSAVPEVFASGAAPYPEPHPARLALFARSTDATRHALARAAREDFPNWLTHVQPVAACARPIRLAGAISTVEATTGRVLSTMDTSAMPDGVIYKRCGNRRASVCPSCSKIYQRDAYQIVRAGIVGGDGIPDTVTRHRSMFTTLTAPSFGAVHNRVVTRHTCTNRSRCDCRAEICHPRRDNPICGHGTVQACWARHENRDRRIGTPICPDCYDYDSHAVWNKFAGELWRRTKQAIDRQLAKLCQDKGVPPVTVGVHPHTGRPVRKPAAQTSCGKAAEFQMRAVVHFHALIRLDGRDPDDSAAIVPPPPALTVDDLDQAITTAARAISFRTPPHPDKPDGWRIAWGEQLYNRPVTLSGHGEVTDNMVASYLAKYATKSTEVTGHTSARITEETIGRYADTAGNHVQRLIAACWRIGRPHHTELLELSYRRLLAVIGTTGLELGRLQPEDTSTQAPVFDRLHTTIGELVGVAEAAPKPLHHRLRHAIPTSGAVSAWVCPACGTGNRTTQCQKCLAPQYERAHLQQQLLFLLLLSGTIHAPQEEPNLYAGLRRWAHMLGFGGHFFSQSARFSAAFRIKRQARISFRRNQTKPPADAADTDPDGEETVLVINSLALAGIGWHTTADAMLANTSSALAREHQQLARHLISTLDI